MERYTQSQVIEATYKTFNLKKGLETGVLLKTKLNKSKFTWDEINVVLYTKKWSTKNILKLCINLSEIAGY